MRTSALLSLLAGVGSVAAAATAKPHGLPKTKLDKDIHFSIEADGLDVKLDVTNAKASVVKPKVFIISMVREILYIIVFAFTSGLFT